MLSRAMPFQRRALLAASAVAASAIQTPPAAAQTPSFRQAGTLRFFAPNDAPFDRAGRRALAEDVLRHLPDTHGLHAGRDAFLLPPTKVLGATSSAHPRPWQLTVPGGVAIYLPAYFSVDGTIDPALTRVTVDGHLLAGSPA